MAGLPEKCHLDIPRLTVRLELARPLCRQIIDHELYLLQAMASTGNLKRDLQQNKTH